MKARKLARATVMIGMVLLGALFPGSTCFGAPPSHAPTLKYPSGKIAGTTITFSWAPVASAAYYQLLVEKGATDKVNLVYTRDQAGCPTVDGTCSVEVTTGFGSGALKWRVRGRNADGNGPWADNKPFTISDELRIPISSLPLTISSSGSYFVTGNLTSTGSGITIEADNVTIDLNGYTLTGPGGENSNGIYMNARKNVEVRNGTIRRFGGAGIWEQGNGRDHRVIDVRVIGNASSGISLMGSGHLVNRCTAGENGGSGIYCAVGSTISGSSARDNTASGISISSGNTIIGNTSYSNGLSGINSYYGNTIKNNTCYFNQHYGIELYFTSLVDGNTASSNNRSGGGYTDIDSCDYCTWGLNVPPTPPNP